MAVQVKDMMLDKVAIGPVSARVYQGAEFGKGSPIVLFFGGGAFLTSRRQECPVAESWRKPARSLSMPGLQCAARQRLSEAARSRLFGLFLSCQQARRARRSQLAASGRWRRGWRQYCGGRSAEGARSLCRRARWPDPDFSVARSLHGNLFHPQGGWHRHAPTVDGRLEPLSERRRVSSLCCTLPLFAHCRRCSGADFYRGGRSSARRDASVTPSASKRRASQFASMSSPPGQAGLRFTAGKRTALRTGRKTSAASSEASSKS